MQFPPRPAPSPMSCFDSVIRPVEKNLRRAPSKAKAARLPKSGLHDPQSYHKSFEQLKICIEPMEARAAEQLEAVRDLVRPLLKSRGYEYHEASETCRLRAVDPALSLATPPYVDPDIDDLVERGRRIHEEWLTLLIAVDPENELTVRKHAASMEIGWILPDEHPVMSLLGRAMVVAWMRMSFYDLQFFKAIMERPTEEQLLYLMDAAEMARDTKNRLKFEVASPPTIRPLAQRPRKTRVRKR